MSNIIDTIAQLQGSGKTFAEFIAAQFTDKIVEIYVGDTYEDVSIEQISTTIPAVFCGKVIGAYKECLVILPLYINAANQTDFGSCMLISERAIRALSEVNGNGILNDCFLSSKATIKIKKNLTQ